MATAQRWILGFWLQMLALTAFSQYQFYGENYVEGRLTWELAVEAGGMNCLTDLGGRKGNGKRFIGDLNWQLTKPVVGISASMVYCRGLGLRLSAVSGSVSATDQVLKKVQASAAGRYLRNLNFFSQVREASVILEMCPFTFLAAKGDRLPGMNAYLIAGIGLFHFDPKADIDQSIISLWPLRTEGEGFENFPERHPYLRTQICIPLGLGVKWEFTSYMNGSIEANWRKLFTDYLDDVSTGYINPALFDLYLHADKVLLAKRAADRRAVSTSFNKRGNPSHNDSYLTCNLRVSFIFGRQRKH